MISSYHDLRDHKGRLKSAPIEHKQEVVNVVIAKHFNHVDDNIQREALEVNTITSKTECDNDWFIQLMHSKQLTTPAGILKAPTYFLFLPLIVRDETPQLNSHLVCLPPVYFHHSVN